MEERAYELYLQRGQEPGHDLGDWLKAEQEIGGQMHKGPVIPEILSK